MLYFIQKSPRLLKNFKIMKKINPNDCINMICLYICPHQTGNR